MHRQCRAGGPVAELVAQLDRSRVANRAKAAEVHRLAHSLQARSQAQSAEAEQAWAERRLVEAELAQLATENAALRQRDLQRESRAGAVRARLLGRLARKWWWHLPARECVCAWRDGQRRWRLTRQCEDCVRLESALVIARSMAPDGPTEPVWEWQDERGRWQAYEPGCCRRLELALARGEPQALVHRQQVRVWLQRRKHVELRTEQSRPCRRRVPVLVHVTVGAPAVDSPSDC